ncbi:trypsin-like peptidase domain-containing protein [Mycolicibacterium sp. P9-64]|uniref:S1C family serine protease n=1 Tax=Mycolicibacterium sp. P9-64 TaxID=2024612 RepID=UPI001F5B6712|nr:trypsin-like peptidase domain-containing protein [Mycolicibacterium sp. P9-64]
MRRGVDNSPLLYQVNAVWLVLGALSLAIISAVAGGLAAITVHPPMLGPIASHVRGGTLLGASVERVAAEVTPSVVKLETTVGLSPVEGSGIVLSADGLILTNNHVVAMPAPLRTLFGAPTTTVTFADGRTAPFVIVGGDPISDIAVVRAQDVSGLVPITVGSSTHLVVGQNVVAVGAPLGMDRTVTTGIISALHRPVTSAGDTPDDYTVLDTIQTDAAINPGSSGGALVDTGGALIGVNAALATTGGDYISGPGGSIGLGFAIPVDQAIRIADELVATGKATHATLGVEVVTDGSLRGAKIDQVASGGPGAAAGLLPGALITKVDDRVITTANDFVAALRSKAPGDTLALTYAEPSGTVETVQVTLGAD